MRIISGNYKGKKIISIEEKPLKPKTDKAIPGIYFFDKNVSKFAKTLKQSKRREYEIVDLINIYIKKNHAEIFCRTIIDDLELDNGFEKRLEILNNLGRTKWLCIVLNVFLPTKNRRISDATGSNQRVMESSKLKSAKDLLDVFRTEETPAWTS